jgi:hypothetical protein
MRAIGAEDRLSVSLLNWRRNWEGVTWCHTSVLAQVSQSVLHCSNNIPESQYKEKKFL